MGLAPLRRCGAGLSQSDALDANAPHVWQSTQNETLARMEHEKLARTPGHVARLALFTDDRGALTVEDAGGRTRATLVLHGSEALRAPAGLEGCA